MQWTVRLLRAGAVGVLAGCTLAAGCAARRPVMLELAAGRVLLPCRVPAASEGWPAPPRIAWRLPSADRDRDRLDDWCAEAGSPVILPDPAGEAPRSDELVVVSWNLHAGEANLAELVRRLRAGAFTGGTPVRQFVLLLQEAYRADPIPAGPGADGRGGMSHGPAAIEEGRTDILRIGRSLGLALYYVPSMRSSTDADPLADRGNAILATAPLSGFSAIELPFERQRRVAVSAVVSGRTRDGRPWRLPVVSVHLDNLASIDRLWLGATGARVRQVRGLLDALPADTPLIVGGDLNTWFGFSDPAYRLVDEAVPDLTADRRPTFGPLFRLDHLFSRLPRGWTGIAGRLDVRLGSDHHALLARIRIGRREAGRSADE